MNTKIETYTGRLFDLLRPDPKDIDLKDIAHSLSLLCRYNGHCKEFYSVAQHSVLMSRFFINSNPLFYLFHDVAEAYMGDITRPLKELIENFYAPISNIENWIKRSVWSSFNLPEMNQNDIQDVHDADLIMLATEKRDLMTDCKWGIELPAPLPMTITPWTPVQAEAEFYGRALELLHKGY
jgi:hypothetical protein